MSLRKQFSISNKRSLAFRVLIFAFCAAGIAWTAHSYNIAQSRDVSASVGGQFSLVKISNLPRITLLDLRSFSRSSLELSNPHKKFLIMFLSAADCWSCLGELPIWKTLADKAQGDVLEEHFILVRTSQTEALSLVRAGIFSEHARVYLDQSNLTVSSLNIPEQTPLTVLIQGGTRQVLAAEGKDTSSMGQVRFTNRVKSLLPNATFGRYLTDLR